MDSLQQLRILWRARWLLLLGVIAAGVSAYIGSGTLPKYYKSDALVQVIPRQQAAGQSLMTDQLLQTTNFYLEIAKTPDVIGSARQRVGTTEGGLEAYAQPDVLVLGFTGWSRDPQRAAAYANAYAGAFREEVGALQEAERRNARAAPERRVAEIRRALADVPAGSAREATLTAELQALQGRLADQALAPLDQVRVLQPAIAPSEPASPNPIRNAALAMLAALVLASSVVILRSATGDRFASAEEAALELRLPVLGQVPPARAEAPPAVEAFRKLRAQLEYALLAASNRQDGARRRRSGRSAARNGDSGGQTILITSAEPGVGKSHVTAGLARSLAIRGRHVIVVDGDLRRPTVHSAFAVPSEPGLTDVLASNVIPALNSSLADVPLPMGARERGGELQVLTAGRPTSDTSEHLAAPQMEEVMAALTARADVVILDSPPVLAIVDAVVLSGYADAVVLVVDARKSKRKNVRNAADTLRGIGAPIVGLVANRARLSSTEYEEYGRPVVEESEERNLI